MPENSVKHDSQVRDYFEAHVADYDAFYEPGSGLQRWFNRLFRKAVYLRRDEVLNLARRFDCRTLLDVGCGSGRNTAWWARNGVASLHGVDVSLEMIKLAKQVAAEAGVEDRCCFEHADFAEWESSQKYDLVASCGVFDYLLDAESVLNRMARFANRVIYGSFPGWTLLRSPLRKLRYLARGCPTHFYRRRELEEIFHAVGFGVFEIKPIDGGYLVWSYRE